jgi:hypothetical protein
LNNINLSGSGQYFGLMQAAMRLLKEVFMLFVTLLLDFLGLNSQQKILSGGFPESNMNGCSYLIMLIMNLTWLKSFYHQEIKETF